MTVWDRVRTPVGWCILEVTDGKLSALRWGRKGRGRPVALPRVRRWMRDFLAGRRFRGPVDYSWATPFERRVYEVVRRIPAGGTRTYGDVARRAGRPGAARAVGRAMGKNRVPLLIPCHRVVAASGLGGFSAPGGLSLKRRLLAREARFR